jgi:hypothetical protein
MVPDKIYQYVFDGSLFHEDEKTYRKYSFIPAFLTVFGGIPLAGGLRGVWSLLGIFMILLSIACIVTTFKLSDYVLTVKDALWLDVLIFGSWTLIFFFIALMCLVLWRGFTPWFLLIYTPNIFIPLFVGMKIHKKLKSENYTEGRPAKGGIGFVGFFAGTLGMSLAAAFRDVGQGTAVIIVAVCFSIVSYISSLNFLSLQKLYYMKKYKIHL